MDKSQFILRGKHYPKTIKTIKNKKEAWNCKATSLDEGPRKTEQTDMGIAAHAYSVGTTMLASCLLLKIS